MLNSSIPTSIADADGDVLATGRQGEAGVVTDVLVHYANEVVAVAKLGELETPEHPVLDKSGGGLDCLCHAFEHLVASR